MPGDHMRVLRSVPAVIAAAAAVSGIWFSAWSAHQQSVQQGKDARVQRQTRAAAELGLLTQLAASVRAATAKINQGSIVDKACVAHHAPPTNAEVAALYDGLATFDYLAWLDNTGQMGDLPKAHGYWVPQMRQAFTIARLVLPDRDLDERFPEIRRFRARHPRGDESLPVC